MNTSHICVQLIIALTGLLGLADNSTDLADRKFKAPDFEQITLMDGYDRFLADPKFDLQATRNA